MKLAIFIFCYYLLLPNVTLLLKTASSYIKIWPVGTNFQPACAVELLSTVTTRSYLFCGITCNLNIQCRTFVYDLLSKQCILYEGEVSTGKILTNTSTTQVGRISYSADLYHCYNKSENQCEFNRYLTTDNSSNVGICPQNTFWNTTMCLNQYYSGTSCTSNNMCRNDIALYCDSFYNQTCSGGYDVNIVKNGNAEIGSCNRSAGGVSPPYWTSTGLLTQLEYSNPDGAVSTTSPGPSDRGQCYFWGGTNPYVYMYQIISLDPYASTIDQNKVSYNISAWLGGWENQDDHAVLWMNFYNSNNSTLANVTLATVYANDRLNMSQLLYRQATGMVPLYTRWVKIQVDMIANTYNNDGSVDDIVLKLKHIP